MEWLPLAVLGIMWAAFLLPTRQDVDPLRVRRGVRTQDGAVGAGGDARHPGSLDHHPTQGCPVHGPCRAAAGAGARSSPPGLHVPARAIAITLPHRSRAAAARRVDRVGDARRPAGRLRLAVAHDEAPRGHVPRHRIATRSRRLLPTTRPRRLVTWPRAAAHGPGRASTGWARSAKATACTSSCARRRDRRRLSSGRSWSSTTSPATCIGASTRRSSPGSRPCPRPAVRSEPARTRSAPCIEGNTIERMR